MKRWYRYLAAMALLASGLFSIIASGDTVQAKDILFIDQQNYGPWVLSRSYNAVSIENTKQSSPVLFQIQPYRYLMTILVTLPKDTKDPPTSIEMDIGDFTRFLNRQENSLTYEINLENANSEQFVDAIKAAKIISIVIDDDDSINIPSSNMDKAIDAMVDFAKEHYILMPYPFSMKLDQFASMPIPDVIPENLYALYRQQAAYDEACHNPKDKDQPTAEVCKQYETVVNVLKKAGFCREELTIPPQIIGNTAPVSYKWETCKSKP